MEYLRIGLVARPQGVHGELKLTPLTDDMRRFNTLSEAYLEQGGSYAPVAVSNVRLGADAVYLRLSSCLTREDAEGLRNAYLCVDRAHAVQLPAGSYFVADLVGCAVTDTLGRAYGKLTEVLETGANDVYVITGKRTLMVPALKKVLFEVDTGNKRMVLNAEVLEEVGMFED